MKYRVVQKSDGLFYAQYRVMPFCWADSLHRASSDVSEVQSYCAFAERNHAKVVRVVAS